MIRFANWWFLLMIPLAIYLFVFGKKRRGLQFSSVKLLRSAGIKKTVKHVIGKVIVSCGVVLSLVALARPQTTERTDFLRRQGIDIAVILDVSGTMRSVDFEPNRLEVARKTIDRFIAERSSDRIALIVFAGTAYTRIPLTLDHGVVRESLADVSLESVSRDGTAIGMAISVGLNRLKKSDTVSRIIILVTDGDNNAGAIDPMTASMLAQEMGIRIYTVGIGSDSLILPVQTFGQIQYRQYQGGFDEELLRRIAETANGLYFRAADPRALERVFDTINQLERTEFPDDHFREYRELAYPVVLAALTFLLIGVVLDKYCFLQIP